MPKTTINEQQSTWFDPNALDRARDLHERVRVERWDTCTMSAEEERLVCSLWVSEARVLLDDPTLPAPDRSACFWVLGAVKQIVNGDFFIHGLSRQHTADWPSRVRRLGQVLRAKRERPQLSQRRESRDDRPSGIQLPVPPHVVALGSSRVLIVGGDQDDAVLDHLADSDLRIEWVTESVRRIQAAVARIRGGRVDGVVFLTDLCGHASFAKIRAACRTNGTPMILSTKGVAGVLRALGRLDEQIGKESA